MKNISTNFFTIGDQEPCYIIAEIGSNHNGSFDQASEMIERAAETGVNAVKFQTFKAESHYSKKTPKISLYKEDIYSLIEKLEIDRTWHVRLSEICKKNKIDFLDSPCDSEAVQIALSVNMPLMKMASFDIVDSRLMDEISKTGKGIIISTGMANLAEIESAINICRKNGNEKIVVLQCTSVYPAPVRLSNLKAMQTLKNAFDIIVGYSDHTLGDHIACASVTLGAKVLEKHYTLNRSMIGPDHAFAMETSEFRDMVQKIRDIEDAQGDGMKNGPRAEEMEFFMNARRSIIAKKDIRMGQIINEDDVIIKRPGYGMPPSMLSYVIGRKAQRDIEMDDPITWNLI